MSFVFPAKVAKSSLPHLVPSSFISNRLVMYAGEPFWKNMMAFFAVFKP